MAIYIGSTPISGIYIGSTPISRAYVGSTLVYQAASVAEGSFTAAGSSLAAFIASQPLFNPVRVPDAVGLIPADAATFDVATGWTVPADITITGGQAVRASGTTNQNLDFSAAGFEPTPGVTSGRKYVFYTDLERTAGTLLNSWTAPTSFNAPGSFGSTSRVFMPMTATGAHGAARFRPNGTFRGAINEAQVYDITDQVDGPLDIYICGGQSNMVGASGETGFATAASVERRALILSGFESTSQGRLTDGTGPTINADLTSSFGVGVPTPIADPTPHSSLNSVGVSPVTAMATAICNSGTEAGRTPLFIAAGDGGSQIDLEWAPDSTAEDGAIAWDLMIAQIDYALSLNPANRIRGMFWCQGESDRSANPDSYAPQLNDRIDRLRTAYGAFPLVIMEIGGDPDSVEGSTGPNTTAMILEQQKLATGSGDASELADCAYVPRPTGWALETDATHFTATTNVVRGQEAAAAMITLLGGEAPKSIGIGAMTIGSTFTIGPLGVGSMTIGSTFTIAA